MRELTVADLKWRSDLEKQKFITKFAHDFLWGPTLEYIFPSLHGYRYSCRPGCKWSGGEPLKASFLEQHEWYLVCLAPIRDEDRVFFSEGMGPEQGAALKKALVAGEFEKHWKCKGYERHQ